jgi:hypothetical protein
MLAPAKGEVSSSRRMRPGEVADHVSSGQTGLAHGLAAGDSDRAELQVQLGGQIERHPLGPLRFHHDLVMADQRQCGKDNHGGNT